MARANASQLRTAGGRSWHDEFRDCPYVRIGNLASGTTDEEILRVFEQYGYAPHLHRPRSPEGKPLPLCFLGYADTRSATVAIDSLNGVELGGRVLVVDGGGSPRRSLLGDNLASAAVKNGWAGIVIFGYLRDVEEIAPMELGVMALGSVPRKTDKRGEGQLGVTLHFGGCEIASNDYLYADETGIIVADRSLQD